MQQYKYNRDIDKERKKFSDILRPRDTPIVIEEAFTSNLISISDITNLFANYNKSFSKRLRLFDRNNKTLDNSIFYKNPPKENECLINWGNRVFSNENYGLIMNFSEENNPIKQKLSTVFDRLFSHDVLCLNTCDVGIFLGNYGYSPFGIHKDVDFSSIIHLSLFGNKQMLTWNEQEYFSITNSYDSYLQPEEIAMTGVVNNLKAFSLFIMPGNQYHVGYTPDFSCSIAIGIKI